MKAGDLILIHSQLPICDFFDKMPTNVSSCNTERSNRRLIDKILKLTAFACSSWPTYRDDENYLYFNFVISFAVLHD